MMLKPGGVFETIKQKMPWARGATIVLQHDGAPGHNQSGNLEALTLAGSLGGWKITIDTQPAQSPDLNLCDLCIFKQLQSASFNIRSQCHTNEQLIANVMQAWDEFDSNALERAWGILHEVYRCILRSKGANTYAIPHTGITARQTAGQDPVDRIIPIDTLVVGRQELDRLNNLEN
jgi:hypothetical protein